MTSPLDSISIVRPTDGCITDCAFPEVGSHRYISQALVVGIHSCPLKFVTRQGVCPKVTPIVKRRALRQPCRREGFVLVRIRTPALGCGPPCDLNCSSCLRKMVVHKKISPSPLVVGSPTDRRHVAERNHCHLSHCGQRCHLRLRPFTEFHTSNGLCPSRDLRQTKTEQSNCKQAREVHTNFLQMKHTFWKGMAKSAATQEGCSTAAVRTPSAVPTPIAGAPCKASTAQNIDRTLGTSRDARNKKLLFFRFTALR